MFRKNSLLLNGVIVIVCISFLVSCSSGKKSFEYRSVAPNLSLKKLQSLPKYKVGTPYRVSGQKYYPREDFSYDRTGIASWYGPDFHGKNTANGEIYNQNDLTAAHKTLPLPTLVEVTNLNNNKRVILRINDRGPFIDGRIIDVSAKAAATLGFKAKGTAPVRVRVLTQDSKLLKAYLNTNRSAKKKGNIPTILSSNNKQQVVQKPLNTNIQPKKPKKNILTWQDFIASSKAADLPDGEELGLFGDLEVDSGANNLVDKQLINNQLEANVSSNKTSSDNLAQANSNYKDVFFLQVGAFSDPNNARANLNKLDVLNYPVKIFPLYRGKKILYRVQVGPFDQSHNIASLTREINNLGFNNVIVINK